MRACRIAAVFFVIVLLLPTLAAANTNYAVLFDVDENAATGCTVGGMRGVERVITTSVDVSTPTPRVAGVYQRICAAGSLGPVELIDGTGWPATSDPVNGLFVVETRIPLSIFGDVPPAHMWIGFLATSGPLSAAIITDADGNPISFPSPQLWRRAVNTPNRTFQLDGIDTDWSALQAVAFGGPHDGEPALRYLNVYGYVAANAFYFRFDSQSHAGAPTAENDWYSTLPDTPLTVSTPGVLGNDTDPNGLALTAAVISPAHRGSVVLNSDGSFTYSPLAGMLGRDVFTYQAFNGAQRSNIARVQIAITDRPNRPPNAADDAYTLDSANVLTVGAPGVLSNDVDPDGDALTAVPALAPQHGSVALHADGSFTYSGDGSPDSFTYRASDGIEQSREATVRIQILPNEPPVAIDDAYGIDEGGTLNVARPGVLANDSDPDTAFAFLEAVLDRQPQHGTLTLNADGSFVYVHDGGETVADTFRYSVSDTILQSPPATVTIVIQPVNDPPAASNDAYNTLEDHVLAIAAPGVLGNDTDPDSGVLTTSVVTPPSNGILTLDANGAFTYAPNANFSGSDTFTYRASDGALQSSPVTVSITITPVNDTPVFTAGPNVTVTEDSGAYSQPWATNLDDGPNENGQALSFIVTNSSNASFSVQPAIDASGLLTFTPAADANGIVTVTVQIHDDGGTANGGVDTSAPVTFTITITPVNDVPSFNAGPDVAALEDSGPYSAAQVTAISAGPADEAGQAVAFTVTNDNNSLFATQPAIAANGTLTFTPAANANGIATISVVATDNGTPNAGSAAQTFTIAITAVNDAPLITGPATATASEDTPFVFSGANLISVADLDAGSGSLTLTLASSNGALTLGGTAGLTVSGNGTQAITASGSLANLNSALNGLVFAPALDFNGGSAVSITVNDNGNSGSGGALTDSEQVSFTIVSVNDAPVATADAYSTTEEQPLVQSAPGVLANDLDVDTPPASLTAVLVSNVPNGTLTLNANGSFTYTPNANFSGADSFTYRTNDGALDSNVVSVTITVSGINDAPVNTVPGAQAAFEDTPLVFSTANGNAISVSDLDAGANIEQVTLTATNGSVTLGSTAAITITGGANNSPSVSFRGTILQLNAALDGTSFLGTPDTSGPATLTVISNDLGNSGSGGALIDNDVVDINLTPVNDPPSFAVGSNVTVNEDSGAYSSTQLSEISPGPTDEVSAGQTVTFTVTNDNNALFAVQPAISPTGVLTFTPAANAFGSATVSVTAADSGSGVAPDVNTSAAQTFNITVSSINDPPSFTIGVPPASNEDGGGQTVNTFATSISQGPLETGQTLAFNLSQTGSTGTIAFTSGPAIDPATGNLTYTATANTNGTATFNATLSDNGSNTPPNSNTSGVQSFTITVTAVNDPPSFVKGADQTVLEDAGTQTVNGWATAISAGPVDESGQTLSFNISNDNNALFSVQPAVDGSGNLTYTPAANVSGAATVTISISDNGGTANGGADTSANQTFLITVTAVNDVPSFTKGADQTVLEDAGAQSVPGWATAISAGPNEGVQTLNFIVTNDNNALFSAQPAVAADGTLTYTPAANANGSATVTIAIHDDGGTANSGVDTSANQTFVINVTAVNDVPSFVSGGNVTVVEDSGAYSAGWATSISKGPADESGQSLTFNITGNTNPALFSVAPSVSATGVLTFTAPADGYGTATITINLQDDGGTANGGDDTSNNITFDITVTNKNDKPSFVSGGDVTVLEDSGAYSAAWATGINPGANEGSQNVSFVVTGNSNPALFAAAPAVSSTGVLTFTPGAGANGSSTITLHIVDDGGTADGGVDTGDDVVFTIFVTAVNDVPSFVSAGNVTVVEDSGAYSASWATSISKGPADESGQSLTFNITGNTNAALFSVAPSVSATGVLTFTAPADVSGTATITINLQDDGGTANGGVDTSAPQSFVISIGEVNDAPSFTKGSDQNVLEDGGAKSVLNWATAISPGPANEALQTVSFTVTNDNNPLFSVQPAVASNGTLTFTLAANAYGTAIVSVVLHDDGGTANGGIDTSAAQTFTIQVAAVNDPPTFSLTPFMTDDTPGPRTITNFATAISPGPPNEAAQTVTLAITNNTNPGMFTVAPAIDNSGTLTFTLAAGMAGQSAVITVTATDDGGTANGGIDSSSQDYTIVLDQPPSVTGTTPANGATSIARTADIVVNFSESVAVTSSSFVFECPAGSGGRAYAMSGSPGTSITLNPTLDLPAGTTCTVTVIANQVSDTDTGDPPDNMASDHVFTFNVQPGAGNDTYAEAVIGNVGANTASSTGFSILTNDVPSSGVTINTSGTSAQGGTVAIAADGTFSYTPPAGYEGGDSFTYTITSATFGTSPSATVNLTVGGMIWFINNAAAAGDGRLSSPFNSLAAFQAVNNGTGNNPAAGDNIFLYESATPYTGPATLLSNQKLIGQDASSTLASIAGVTVSADSFALPSMNLALPAATVNSSSGGVNAVNLNGVNTGNVVRGLSITTGSATSIGVSGNNFGMLTAAEVSISGTGPALILSNGSLNASFASISSSGGANNVSLTAIGGTATLGGGAMSGASGTSFLVASSNATLTYSGSIAHTASGSSGVSLTNNTGATISLSGGLSLSTGTATAFNATGGGTINVTGTNTITTTTGTAVNINGTTIGASGVTFQSVNSTTAGSNSAIALNTTGAGAFTITGTGTTAGSGGTISNKSVDAVTLNTSGGLVTLKNMNIQDISAAGDTTAADNTRSGVDAIHGVNVNGGLTLDGVAIRRVSDDGVNGSVDGATPSATAFNGLTITNCTIEDTNRFSVAGHGDGNNEAAVYINGIRGTLSVTGSTIQRAGSGLDLTTATSGTLDMTVRGNNFLTLYKEPGGTVIIGTWGISLMQAGSLSSTVRIGDTAGESNPALGNVFTNNQLASIRLVTMTGSTGSMLSSIAKNTFSVTDHLSPGCSGATPGNCNFSFPQGGVLLRAQGSGAYNSIFAANALNGVMDADMTSVDRYVAQLAILAQNAASQFIVRNNTFTEAWDGDVWIQAVAGSARVLFAGNTHDDSVVVGNHGPVDDLGVLGFCPSGCVTPYLPFKAQTIGGVLDLTIQNEGAFGAHDTISGYTYSFYALTSSSGDTFNLFLQNTRSPRGYQFATTTGAPFNLYRNGSGAGTAQGVLQANGNTGGLVAGIPNDTKTPPDVSITGSGSVTLSATAPALPSITPP